MGLNIFTHFCQV